MDALYKTIYRILNKIEYFQVSEYIEKYLDVDRSEIIDVENLYNMIYETEEKKKIKLPPIDILPDSDEQKQYKLDFIDRVFLMIDKLHEIGISHGDTHINNFMIDKTGKLYLIDFGLSKNLNEKNYKTDYLWFESSIKAYCGQRSNPHLNYIAEYTKYKVKNYNF
jgi:tRNA A-37 threonylcarbamoyl transferase component Bud32